MTYEIPEESRPQMSKFRRRAFLARGGGLAIAAALGMHVPFGRHFPAGLMPVALANGLLDEYGKDKELIILGDKPFVAETPAHLLDEEVTSTRFMFVRNNGLLPDREQIDPQTWTLTIDGESVASSRTFTLSQLKSRFENVTRQLTLECGGNGRSEFYPPAKGNQWTYGGVGFPAWTGVRLRDVLTAAGVKDDAVYIGYYGADVHLSGDPAKQVISRGVPIAKAMDDESLLVWGMNGAELPLAHGYPLRLVLSGYPASASGKWVKRIAIRNKVHDGQKMGGHDYRLPCEGIAPGETSDNYCVMENMPVKSLITFPKSGLQHTHGKGLNVRGQAWTGTSRVQRVDLSIDFGQTWTAARLGPARNRYAPQRFASDIEFPAKGYYEIWARAADETGRMQPMVVPGWNVGGYGNNACHRIALKVG
jgi:sulfite oxidase